jgi:hypothetical protein
MNNEEFDWERLRGRLPMITDIDLLEFREATEGMCTPGEFGKAFPGKV